MSNGKKLTKRRIKKRIMTAFERKTFFVWRVTYICVHVTQAQFLPTSSKHVSPGMRFLGLGIGGLSHQSCMSLHIGTNNIVGGSITRKFRSDPGSRTNNTAVFHTHSFKKRNMILCLSEILVLLNPLKYHKIPQYQKTILILSSDQESVMWN